MNLCKGINCKVSISVKWTCLSSISGQNTVLVRNCATQRLNRIVKLSPYQSDLQSELRSDHAGEVGAVFIYKGASHAIHCLKVIKQSQQSQIVQMESFVTQHLATEQNHLDIMNMLVSKPLQTKLVPVWKLCGWTLGFFPTLIFGKSGLYVTVNAVETFVEKHYGHQIQLIDRLISNQDPNKDTLLELQQVLKECCEDEVHHKDDAKSRLEGSTGRIGIIWGWIVEKGSEFAVTIAKKI